MGGGVCDFAGVCVRVFLFEVLRGYEPECVLCGDQCVRFPAMEAGRTEGKGEGDRIAVQAFDLGLPGRGVGCGCGFVCGDVWGVVAFYGFARACGGCVYDGFECDSYVDAGEADFGALVVLGGD